MNAKLNCEAGDIAFIKPSFAIPQLHDRIVHVVKFIGINRGCGCCVNAWGVELQGTPLHTAIGPWTRFAIDDRHLRPIRPGKEPEDVSTEYPLEQAPA